MKKFLIFFLLCFLLGACNAIPINPETNQPLVPNIEKYDHEQRLGIQQEVINMQEKQKERQESEHLELKKQEHYNDRAERFKTK